MAQVNYRSLDGTMVTLDNVQCCNKRTMNESKLEIPNYALIDDLTEGIWVHLYDAYTAECAAKRKALEAKWEKTSQYKILLELIADYQHTKQVPTHWWRYSKDTKKKDLKSLLHQMYDLIDSTFKCTSYRGRHKSYAVGCMTKSFMDAAQNTEPIQSIKYSKDEVRAKLLMLNDIKSKTWQELIDYVKQ